jgi:hypothetical protein
MTLLGILGRKEHVLHMRRKWISVAKEQTVGSLKTWLLILPVLSVYINCSSNQETEIISPLVEFLLNLWLYFTSRMCWKWHSGTGCFHFLLDTGYHAIIISCETELRWRGAEALQMMAPSELPTTSQHQLSVMWVSHLGNSSLKSPEITAFLHGIEEPSRWFQSNHRIGRYNKLVVSCLYIVGWFVMQQ